MLDSPFDTGIKPKRVLLGIPLGVDNCDTSSQLHVAVGRRDPVMQELGKGAAVDTREHCTGGGEHEIDE